MFYKRFYYFITLVSVISCLFLTSCRSVVEVPVQNVEKIIYRDSLIYVKDIITIEVPYETIREVIPMLDTSIIKTSVAESVAYLDTCKMKIHHTLVQKGELEVKYDTVVKIEYVDKIIERDVPVKVEVIKYKRDALFWVLASWALLCLFLVIIKLFVLK